MDKYFKLFILLPYWSWISVKGNGRLNSVCHLSGLQVWLNGWASTKMRRNSYEPHLEKMISFILYMFNLRDRQLKGAAKMELWNKVWTTDTYMSGLYNGDGDANESFGE